MMQAPMICSPLKQTNEIDWIGPLKNYIRQTYGDDPERYAEECATLNRLRQDMRGAGRDSASGRDLLYRYYGQLELLDLRFPVDENHIKISFTWFDAFTHKPTSQYSLAYEKASIIFNISAVLSCHAADQNRSEDSGLKTAYHSFQASAGMFTYINENFLHAPSTDLSRDTVKTLIAIMLAQGQEVFLEKQISDDKKHGLLAKLASQAAFLYAQAAEGVQENVTKAIFEKVWLTITQIKANHILALAQYYQALADNDANSHGIAIGRLQVAEGLVRDANRVAKSFPQTVPTNANLGPDTGTNLIEMTERLLAMVQEKLKEFVKDNDFIYHQPVPAEAALTVIPKLPAAKAIPVSELYAGQDIQRIIGPDIFQKIVPMSVTESASLYDEEKAKLVRAETEKVEIANGEMEASLDYLKLPHSLKVLKGGFDQEVDMDEDFRIWCEDLAGHDPLDAALEQLKGDKMDVVELLDQSIKQLDLEESVCEKMRSKYGGDWTQQPSSRLTSTMRSDSRSYRRAIEEATGSDAQLYATWRQFETEFDEMRSAGEADEADILYQRALLKISTARGKSRGGTTPLSASEPNLLEEDYGEGGFTVLEQIGKVEDLLKRLTLIKRERDQVLKDLKEKAHSDDISNVLILNKKSIADRENELFQAELAKYRPHQTRLMQANHKQASLMKELTVTYSDLLQDKRVRSEQSKYEGISRQRNAVLSRYGKAYQAFNDLNSGLQKARQFYTDIRETVESLHKNVDTFVNNRRSEGAQLLNQIEQQKNDGAGGQADRERERLKELMERMSMDPSNSTSPVKAKGGGHRPLPISTTGYSPQSYTPSSPPPNSRFPPANMADQPPMPGHHNLGPNGNFGSSQAGAPRQSYIPGAGNPVTAPDTYNPQVYSPREAFQPPISPPPNQQYFSPPPGQYGYATQLSPQMQQQHKQPIQQHLQQQQQGVPPGYVPPPPPPGPPPLGPQQTYPVSAGGYGSGSGAYAPSPAPGQQRHSQPPGQSDPWAALGAWK